MSEGNEMISSDQVLLEDARPDDNETKRGTRQRANILKKMTKGFLHEMMEPDDNENVFVCISEACKSEASRQSIMLLEVAEGLCKEDSPTLQRKGKVFKKLAPEVEKHVFHEMQRELCKNMWNEARKQVYGTPLRCYKEAVVNGEETNLRTSEPQQKTAPQESTSP